MIPCETQIDTPIFCRTGSSPMKKRRSFWDTHSITDCGEFVEPVEVDVDIQRRHFEIEVDSERFLALREAARRERKPIKELASEILKHRLIAG